MKKYGLLIDDYKVIKKPNLNAYNNPLNTFELKIFYELAVKAKQILTLYEQLLNKEEKTIKNRITFYRPKNLTIAYIYLDRSLDNLHQELNKIDWKLDKKFIAIWENPPKKISTKHYYDVALDIIKSKVNHYLRNNINPSIKNINLNQSSTNYDWKFTEIKECRNLLGVMYLQFAYLLMNKTPTGICNWCGNRYELTRKDKKFCSDSCRYKHYRHKKKQEKTND